MTRQSLFEDEPKRIEDLKLKCKIIPIKYEDIVFSPLSQILCQNCGMYGRNYRCPPHNRKYFQNREYLKQFNKFILIISESNLEQMKERYRHEIEDFNLHPWKAQFYMGTQQQAINLGRSRKDLRTILKFIKTKHNKYIGFASASCLKCKPCKIHSKLPCSHPFDSFSSPESSGIDLYSTLKKVGYTNFESPPIWRYVAVCMIAYKE